MHRFNRKEMNMKFVSVLLTLSLLLGILPPMTLFVRAADETVTFSTGAVILDSTYSGKTVYIKNGVFSVTVIGATDLNVIFEDVSIDRRAATDRAAGGLNGSTTIRANVIDDGNTVGGISQGTTLREAVQAIGWGDKAPVCPFLITGNSTVTANFRGTCTFYAGTNNCTVDNSNKYDAPEKYGCGYAGIQVDSGSALTIEFAEDLTVYGAHQLGTPDKDGYVSVTRDGVTTKALYSDTLRANANIDAANYDDPYDNAYNACPTHTQFSESGGAGIGGGAAYNTSSSNENAYTQGTPGTIIINGGNIEAFGGYAAAGIGGGVNGAATTSLISVNGGNVIAHGGRFSAGIGDGDSAGNPSNSFTQANGLIEINGGTVTAYGGVASPGIGCTDDMSQTDRGFASGSFSKLQINVNGGMVNAFSGFPSEFNGVTYPNEAPAAIGAGAKSTMAANSIYISSDATLSCAGFGNYSLTENGTRASTVPTINIDSEGYLLLLRTEDYYSDESRVLNLYRPQKTTAFPGYGEMTVYISQPEDHSQGTKYYVDKDGVLFRDNGDGTLTQINPDETDVSKLHLTLYVDENSELIDTIELAYFFRSIALTLPDPNVYGDGGLYALAIPTDGIKDTVDVPYGGNIVLTVEGHEQGTQSGKINYPTGSNLGVDAVSDPLTDLDINGSATTDGLIGDDFMPKVYGYTVYFPYDAASVDLYAAFEDKEKSYSIRVDGTSVPVSTGSNKISTVNRIIDVSGVDEKVVRLSKQDNGIAGVSYKITLVRMGKYDLQLTDPSKTYDGQQVETSVQGVITTVVPDTYAVRDVLTGGSATGNLQRPSGTVATFDSENVYLGSSWSWTSTTYHYVNLTMTVTAAAANSANTVNYYVKVVAEEESGDVSINGAQGHMLGFAVTYDPATGSRTRISRITDSPGGNVLNNATWISNQNQTTIASAGSYYGSPSMTLTVANSGTVTLRADGQNYVIFAVGDTATTATGTTGNKDEQRAAAEAAAAQGDATKTFAYTTQGSFTTTQAFDVRTLSSSGTTNNASEESATATLQGTSTMTGRFELELVPGFGGDPASLPEEDLAGAVLTYFKDNGDGTYTQLSGPPKDAGSYKVEASIVKESYTAFGSRVFTISPRPVTVKQIENWLRYMTNSEYAQLIADGPSARLPVIDPDNPPAEGDFSVVGVPGEIYLDNVVSGDDLRVTVTDAYYNDFAATFGVDKITLTGVTLQSDSSVTLNNYTTESIQTVFGQISCKTQGVSLFLKTQNGDWRKYYGKDENGTPVQVTPGNADYHSPATGDLYLSHTEYVMARTVNNGSRSARYAVDIEFGAMHFGFYRSAWDVNELAYVELTDSRWVGMDGNNNHITLINYSNRPVWYQMSVELERLQQDVGGTGRGITPKITSDQGGSTVVSGTAWSEIPAAAPGNITAVGTESTSARWLHLSGVPQLDSATYVPVGVINILVSPTGSSSA